MAKRILYMIALAFLLQATWSVVSAYCMHESGKASQHFGHHQHQHQAEKLSSEQDNTPPAKKAVFHPDCASCSHSPLVILAWAADAAPAPSSTHHELVQSLQHPAPFLGMPERPQWVVAA